LQEEIAPAVQRRDEMIEAITQKFEEENRDKLDRINRLTETIDDHDAKIRMLAVDEYYQREEPDNKRIVDGLGVQVRTLYSLTVNPDDKFLKKYVEENYPKLLIVDEKRYLKQYKLDNDMPSVHVETNVSAVIKSNFWESDGEVV